MTGEPDTGGDIPDLGSLLVAAGQTDIVAFRNDGRVLDARCSMIKQPARGDNVYVSVPVLQGLQSALVDLKPDREGFVLPRVTLTDTDGRNKTIDISISATDELGTLLMVARPVFDDPTHIKSITSRRRLEYLEGLMEEERARFELIYRRSPALAFVLSDDEESLTWSDAFEQWAGGTPKLARAWIEGFRKDRLSQSPDLKNDRVLHGVRSGLTDGAGRICAVDLYRYRVRRPRTRSSDDYFVIQDVTSILSALRVVERQSGQMAALNRKLQISNSRLSDFSRVAAHDLVGPLGRIASFSEVIAIDLAQRSETIDGALDAIRRSAQSSIELVGDLLELANLGTIEPQPKICDVEALAFDAFNLHASGINDGAGAPYMTFEGPRNLDADPRLLRLILRNTIGNSVKFRSSARALRVAVQVRRMDGDFVLTIRDDGMGFDPRDDRDVFDILVRATSNADLPGSGLGLSLVRDAAQMMGFSVSLEGRIDQGTRFVMRGPDPGP